MILADTALLLGSETARSPQGGRQADFLEALGFEPPFDFLGIGECDPAHSYRLGSIAEWLEDFHARLDFIRVAKPMSCASGAKPAKSSSSPTPTAPAPPSLSPPPPDATGSPSARPRPKSNPAQRRPAELLRIGVMDWPARPFGLHRILAFLNVSFWFSHRSARNPQRKSSHENIQNQDTAYREPQNCERQAPADEGADEGAGVRLAFVVGESLPTAQPAQEFFKKARARATVDIRTRKRGVAVTTAVEEAANAAEHGRRKTWDERRESGDGDAGSASRICRSYPGTRIKSFLRIF